MSAAMGPYVDTERVLSPGEVVEATPTAAEPQVWSENLNITLMCKECREVPPNIVEETSSGDTVCGSCGLVLQQHVVDTRSEWRTFSNDDQGNDDPSRVGEAANPLLNGSQLSSTIAFGQGDIISKELNRAQNKSSENKGNKALLQAYQLIGHYAESISLPTTVSNTAKQLFKLVEESKQFRGKSQETIIAGCLFIACRQCNVPRTFKEITTLTQVPKKEVGRVFKELEKFFKRIVNKTGAPGLPRAHPTDNGYKATNSTAANELCGRFGSGLSLPAPVSLIAGECAEIMLTRGQLAGRSPLSVAAVALYVISNLMGFPKTPKEISVMCGVSDGTIRAAWRKIYDTRLELIKPEWLNRGGKIENLPPQ
jgi:transcription initiation factor TFIIB